MANGRDFERAIDRLAADLTRIAEKAIAQEVARALALAVPKLKKDKRKARIEERDRAKAAARLERAKRTAERRAARAAERAERKQARDAERAERETTRLRRKEERDQLRDELKSARDAVRQAKAMERAKAKQESVASREARHRALTEKAAAPPPVVVFKRSRDGQVTVLKPQRPAETEAAAPAPQPAAGA